MRLQGISNWKRDSYRLLHPFRMFFGTYLVMILWSVLELAPRQLQTFVVLLWIFGMFLYSDAWRRRTGKHLKLTLNIILAQLPGLMLAGLSFSASETGKLNEWMNGGLEVWTSPFLRLWEWLPRTTYGGLSATYLAACLTPYMLVCLQISWYFLAPKLVGKRK